MTALGRRKFSAWLMQLACLPVSYTYRRAVRAWSAGLLNAESTRDVILVVGDRTEIVRQLVTAPKRVLAPADDADT
jgi:hypothetical protein